MDAGNRTQFLYKSSAFLTAELALQAPCYFSGPTWCFEIECIDQEQCWLTCLTVSYHPKVAIYVNFPKRGPCRYRQSFLEVQRPVSHWNHHQEEPCWTLGSEQHFRGCGNGTLSWHRLLQKVLSCPAHRHSLDPLASLYSHQAQVCQSLLPVHKTV